MTDIRQRLVPALKILIGLFFLTVLVVIAINFISYSKKQPYVKRVEKTGLPENKEKKEKIEFTETDGDQESLKGMADEHFEGDDGLIHARGNVWLRYKEKYELLAEEIIYDREQTHFLLEGKARIRFEDAMLEGSSVEYDRTKDIFKTNQAAIFRSERMTGSARAIQYNLQRKELELDGRVSLRFTPRLDTSHTLLVKGDSLTYSRMSLKGRIEGGVTLVHGQSQGVADSVGFELYEKEDHVRFVFLEGHVEATLVEERGGRTERWVQADEVFLQTFLNFPKVHAVEAKGQCRFRFTSPSGEKSEGASDFLKFVLSRYGGLREFHAIGQASLKDGDRESDNRRAIEGESLMIVEAVKGLQIKGREERKGRLQTELFEITAEEILLDTENSDMSASGDVKVILTPNRKEAALGFFSQEDPVFLTADRMEYKDRQKRFVLRGSAKCWQAKEILMADEMTLDKETGKIHCEGDVITVFPYTSKSTNDEVRVEVSGRVMDADPANQVVIFQDKCLLRTRDVSMSSDSISIAMAEDGEVMETVRAEGDVVISQQQFEGRGKKAEFDVENETIALLGNPVLVDKNRGKVEGDKLTFYLGDDKIVVENQGQERSLTVIK